MFAYISVQYMLLIYVLVPLVSPTDIVVFS